MRVRAYSEAHNRSGPSWVESAVQGSLQAFEWVRTWASGRLEETASRTEQAQEAPAPPSVGQQLEQLSAAASQLLSLSHQMRSVISERDQLRLDLEAEREERQLLEERLSEAEGTMRQLEEALHSEHEANEKAQARLQAERAKLTIAEKARNGLIKVSACGWG